MVAWLHPAFDLREFWQMVSIFGFNEFIPKLIEIDENVSSKNCGAFDALKLYRGFNYRSAQTSGKSTTISFQLRYQFSPFCFSMYHQFDLYTCKPYDVRKSEYYKPNVFLISEIRNNLVNFVMRLPCIVPHYEGIYDELLYIAALRTYVVRRRYGKFTMGTEKLAWPHVFLFREVEYVSFSCRHE